MHVHQQHVGVPAVWGGVGGGRGDEAATQQTGQQTAEQSALWGRFATNGETGTAAKD
jgi:hypothetical protein